MAAEIYGPFAQLLVNVPRHIGRKLWQPPYLAGPPAGYGHRDCRVNPQLARINRINPR